MKVVVTGIGFVSVLGGLNASWRRLLNGESGIQQQQPFPDLPPRPLALIKSEPTLLGSILQRAVADALQDAGLVTPLSDCGVVIGSSRGYQALWEQLAWQRFRVSSSDAPQPPIPNPQWLETLPHHAAIATARQIGSTGPVLAPMAACATGIWAIAQGFELIQSGQCQRVIAGAVEAPVTPLTLTGFDRMGALARTGSYPFDRHREGLVLGEGGAVLVLESAHSAKQRVATVYGELLGFGLTCDAYHVSAPAPGRGTAITAIKQCLAGSRLSSTDIHYIHAHGTGTQLNDQNEAQLIQTVFPQGVPVSSSKGATGHTLGASGALGAALCLMTLRHQHLPPCVGLKEPEFDLNLLTTPRQSEIHSVLCFSFGFGGQNGAIAFGRC